MDDSGKTRDQLIQELDDLRRRIAELEKSETEHKRAKGIIQSRLRMLTAANKNTLTMEEFLQVALDEIEGLTGSTIGFYHFLEADQEMLSLQNWSTNTLRKMCTAEGKGSHYPISQAGVWVDCVAKRRPVIHNDYSSLSQRKGLPPGHAPVVRELVVPIMRDSQIVAIIGVGNKPSDYNKTDVDITSLLGDFSWEIVERKRVEEDLKKAHKVTRNILNSISDAFFSLDDNLTVTFFNQAAEHLLGRKSNEVLGCNLFDAFPEARGSIFEDRYREALRTKQFISFETYFDVEPYQNWYEVRAYPQEYGISVFFQVTTERKRAEEAILESEKRLRWLNEHILNMLMVLSHDVRGPLISIVSILKLLLRGAYGKLDQNLSNTIEDLLSRCVRLLGTTEDYLGKASIVDGSMVMEREVLDLRQDIIDPVLDELADDLTKNEIVIDNRLRTIPAGSIPISGNKTWLKAVYRNLFTNAIKYGGKGCTISFGFELHESHYHLNVYNSGTPIPEPDRQRLFVRFGRIESDGRPSRDGVGLGLSLCQEIILDHGGEIWYEGLPNGSNFVFTISREEVGVR